MKFTIATPTRSYEVISTPIHMRSVDFDGTIHLLPTAFTDLEIPSHPNLLISVIEGPILHPRQFELRDIVTGTVEIAEIAPSPAQSPPLSGHTSLTIDDSGLPIPHSESY